MLEQVLRSLRNWFVKDFRCGTYTVFEGSVELPFLMPGQYFRIVGSVYNDGLHQYPVIALTDETFKGEIWALAIPKEVIALSKDVEEWQNKNGETALGLYSSESFGGYSYERGADPITGGNATWETAFRNRLDRWRKV